MSTTAEVADELSVTPWTVRRWVRDGDLQAVRLGTGPRPHYRIARRALEEFVRPVHEDEEEK